MTDLRQLSPDSRQSRMASDEFKERFSVEEREIMDGLARGILEE
jgi:hypothetical protein